MRDHCRILLAVLSTLFVGTIACSLFTPTVSPETPAPATPAQQAPALEATLNLPLATTFVEPTPETSQHDVFVPGVESGGGGQAGLSGGGQQVEPYIAIDPGQLTIQVGETVTVTGRPVNIGLPIYSLVIQDEGVQNAPPVMEVNYSNETKPGAGSSQVVELLSAQGSMDQVIFVLRAKAAGVTTLTINATGEIHQGDEGGATWGGGSGSILITVTP